MHEGISNSIANGKEHNQEWGCFNMDDCEKERFWNEWKSE